MKNGLRMRFLPLALALIFLFSGQPLFSQTTALQSQDKAAPQVQANPELNKELEQKRIAILKLVSLLDDPESIRKLYDFFVVAKETSIHYVDEKSFAEILNLSLIGMVEGLDPYSHLFMDEQAEAVIKELTEEDNYIGSGMAIMSFRKNTFVTEVLDNSPASKAGIQAGDEVLRVNGKSVYGLSSREVGGLIRGGGEAGTSVTIEIKNPRLQKPKSVTLVRQKVVAQSIVYRELKRGVSYIRIRSFLPPEEVAKSFREALSKASDKELIIDLRDNTGGSMEDVNKMVGFIVGPEMLLVSAKGRDEEFRMMTPNDVYLPKPPSRIVVLVNNFSASASEIMAGVLKHYKKATVIGVRTHGKAVFQNYLGLDRPKHSIQGSRLILGVTTGRYYLPDGTNITGNGVGPDIEVEQPDDFKDYEVMTKRDAQLQAALNFLKKK